MAVVRESTVVTIEIVVPVGNEKEAVRVVAGDLGLLDTYPANVGEWYDDDERTYYYGEAKTVGTRRALFTYDEEGNVIEEVE